MLYEEARVYLDSVSKYGSVLGLDSRLDTGPEDTVLRP